MGVVPQPLQPLLQPPLPLEVVPRLLQPLPQPQLPLEMVPQLLQPILQRPLPMEAVPQLLQPLLQPSLPLEVAPLHLLQPQPLPRGNITKPLYTITKEFAHPHTALFHLEALQVRSCLWRWYHNYYNHHYNHHYLWRWHHYHYHNHNCRQEKTPDCSKPNQGRVEPEDGQRRKFIETLRHFVHIILFYIILKIHLLMWDM